jgi:hypothetical protein
MAAMGVVTVLALGFLVFQAGSSDRPDHPEEVDRYLAAWKSGDFAAMAELVADPPADFGPVHQQMKAALAVREARFDAGEADLDGDRGVVPVSVRLVLGGLGAWEYEIELPLVRGEDGWRVRWSPAVLHPEFREGYAFTRTRMAPVRAPLTDRDGQPLAEGTAPLIVGSVGPASAGDAAALGPEFLQGDTIGYGGLEERYNHRLLGDPAGQVQAVPVVGGAPILLHRFPGATPEPLRTTFDPQVQAAAQQAISIAGGPAALVAVDPPTGEILAVANNPEDGSNRAISGSYPPGSTFKVVTTNALLEAGVEPDVPVNCPATANGFGNFAGESFGTIPFAEAFYRSCNTSFIIQTNFLADGDLQASAEQFGFNVDYDIGVDAVRGSFPAPQNQADELAGAIGQGRVTTSPMHMASVAAAVADGSWRPPTLVGGEDAPDGPEPIALDEGIDSTLQDLMRRVVDLPEGTGHAAAIAGRAIGGKTGTAEFGPEDPPETHAWFIGFDERLAFSILVEGGGSGGSVAAPIAQRFLAAVPPPFPAPPATEATTTTTGSPDG